MSGFTLAIDERPFTHLDDHALLACQTHNYGNHSDWFGNFRGGLYGMYSRLHAVRQHFYEVHAWKLEPRILANAEYHLSVIFFGMDSAIECLTFSLNALGNAIDASLFHDVTDEKALRKISPFDILGRGKAPPLPGYATHFPSLQAYWQSENALIDTIMIQHDVSKHRQTIFRGGKVRDDPPPGFYEAAGVVDDKYKILLNPMEEIILDRDPKSPRCNQTPTPHNQRLTVESICESFASFFNKSSGLALDDATRCIPVRQLAESSP